MADSEGIKIALDDLTLGELEEFEDITGVPATSLGNGGNPPMKAVTALVYLTRKREDPTYTLDQARGERIGAVAFGGEPDPTDSSDDGGAAG